MYKSRSRSMQRGTHFRQRAEAIPVYDESHPPRLTVAETAHFKAPDGSIEVFVERLRPAIDALARNGFRKPSQVAKSLNAQSLRTAAGEFWTPRLANFLLQYAFGGVVKVLRKHRQR